MPVWFQNQMMRAFYEKDRYQIKLLNQCWFFYRQKQDISAGDE
ncbi:cortex morphogenetic protein CmpA [Bacillus sp. B15-48]|nr:cortex morphogenetic protein CmpA [Bacillus sp. B15-48]MBM4765484.1 cortex morphogenetic protein CmpA [Bacillus sp. B15-48]